jgi:hypothetical protein
MTDKTWKKVERRIAKFFGTVRTPLSGRSSRHTKSDSLHDSLFIEVKHRKRIPFLATFKETSKSAKEEGKTPLVVIVEKGSTIPLVICNLHDLPKVAKELPERLH